MPRACSICHHKKKRDINRELVRGTAIRGISRKFRVSEDALSRHKAHVKSAIERAVSRMKSESTVDAAKVLRRLAVLGIQDPRKLFNEQGAFKDINELDAETAATIAGLDFVNLYEGEGDQKHCFGQLRKVKLVNPVQPLTKLGEHLGLFQPSPLPGAQVAIVVHYGDERQKHIGNKPETPTIDVTPQIVVKRLPAELPEPGPAAQPEVRPALPEPSPPVRVERVAPASGGAVRVPGPPIFDFSKPL
jgi:hypothetical protein